MLTIAHLTFSSPFVLAPLAGYSDLPFRILCREFGAGYCVSEMISCHGLSFKQPRTIEMLQSVAVEKPVAFQLFGAEPEIMGEAAAIMSQYGPDLIDINMGCPVKKVTKRGAGAALMTDIPLAEKIINAVRNNTSIPVTVKFRSGPSSREINAVEFALMAEGAGAAALTVHGRTWAQAFTGVADRQIIAKVKAAVDIPVIGNGDIQSYEDGLSMIEDTGCDGVMVGRGALGNPWVFSPEGRPSSQHQLMAGALRHLELMEEFLPVEKMIGSVKNQVGRYFKGMRGSSRMRAAVYDCASFKDLKNMLTTAMDTTVEEE
ncbi:tRNA dihydrouridine synthase DusB [Desulfopila aestuarii]|uniref:tRNA-dihydrouridine synthase n=1 Tax=Desulfopila aestuarii DSM 18488 TaxID=1121416 RepID=A0A1M7Y431_9BACT|nr:tRNA dihydrouridine synthase DusB [Desulfopila aestuarii]SHO46959.1 tRNA-U20-dihydrouridine synthase [Desulfopila aestuarii DSM 18488]